jgi:hypothetical protein
LLLFANGNNVGLSNLDISIFYNQYRRDRRLVLGFYDQEGWLLNQKKKLIKKAGLRIKDGLYLN